MKRKMQGTAAVLTVATLLSGTANSALAATALQPIVQNAASTAIATETIKLPEEQKKYWLHSKSWSRG
ncbi:hypothetical protein [Brevibacillus sp. NRS-1366]|uniref:hypothetical protein n=1 Tax=Brevibacillus sp. NRS-1366 TaxID=3233899 RepID=UPI003D2145E1